MTRVGVESMAAEYAVGHGACFTKPIIKKIHCLETRCRCIQWQGSGQNIKIQTKTKRWRYLEKIIVFKTCEGEFNGGVIDMRYGDQINLILYQV